MGRENRRDEKRMKLFNVIVFTAMVLNCVLMIAADGGTTTGGPTHTPTSAPKPPTTTGGPPAPTTEPSPPETSPEATEETTPGDSDDGILLMSHSSPALMAMIATMAHWAGAQIIA